MPILRVLNYWRRVLVHSLRVAWGHMKATLGWFALLTMSIVLAIQWSAFGWRRMVREFFDFGTYSAAALIAGLVVLAWRLIAAPAEMDEELRGNLDRMTEAALGRRRTESIQERASRKAGELRLAIRGWAAEARERRSTLGSGNSTHEEAAISRFNKENSAAARLRFGDDIRRLGSEAEVFFRDYGAEISEILGAAVLSARRVEDFEEIADTMNTLSLVFSGRTTPAEMVDFEERRRSIR